MCIDYLVKKFELTAKKKSTVLLFTTADNYWSCMSLIMPLNAYSSITKKLAVLIKVTPFNASEEFIYCWKWHFWWISINYLFNKSFISIFVSRLLEHKWFQWILRVCSLVMYMMIQLYQTSNKSNVWFFLYNFKCICYSKHDETIRSNFHPVMNICIS